MIRRILWLKSEICRGFDLYIAFFSAFYGIIVSSKTSLIEDKEFEELAKHYIEIHQEESFIKKQKENLKKRMIEFTDDGNCYGFGVKIRKNLGRKIIKWNKVCEKFNIKEKDLRPFTEFGYASHTILVEKQKKIEK